MNVEIHSSIPVAVGLGSSAAVVASSVATVDCLLDLDLSLDEIFHLAFEAERLVHVTPSGIDPAICTYGGALMFYKDKGFTRLYVETEIPLVIGNTGVERSTGELVALVHQMRDRHPSIIDPIIKAGGKISLTLLKL